LGILRFQRIFKSCLLSRKPHGQYWRVFWSHDLQIFMAMTWSERMLQETFLMPVQTKNEVPCEDVSIRFATEPPLSLKCWGQRRKQLRDHPKTNLHQPGQLNFCMCRIARCSHESYAAVG